MKIKDRVKKLIRVKASEIRPNPWNFRKHPDKQKKAFRELLDEVGVAGAVLCRELKDGTYGLIDGHMRREELGEGEIPVLVVDLNEKEAKKLLAAYDPIGDMSELDEKAFDKLVDGMEVMGENLGNLFSELRNKEGKKLATKELDLDIDEDDDEEDEESENHNNNKNVSSENSTEASHVRMVQLFLDLDSVVEFEGCIGRLGRSYGTKTVTDTVMEAVRHADAALPKVENNEKEEKEVKRSKKKVVVPFDEDE